MKYKIIKEYGRFYVCEYETALGVYRECFLKKDCKVKNGYVIVKMQIEQHHEGLPSEKVNKYFNPNDFGNRGVKNGSY